MGKVDFKSGLMKRLEQQLEKSFPRTSKKLSGEDKSDLFQISHLILNRFKALPDMPEEIELQRISAEKYGKTLRSYLDRHKKNNHHIYTDDICAEVNIQRTYLYKILKGERRPSRDLAIAFCFIFNMTVKESQDHILFLGEQLNEGVKRDYIILFGLQNRIELDYINEILEHYNERPIVEWE
jgi:hypothetical protein